VLSRRETAKQVAACLLVDISLELVDGNDLLREPRFLQEERDLGGIGRGMVVELEHGV